MSIDSITAVVAALTTGPVVYQLIKRVGRWGDMLIAVLSKRDITSPDFNFTRSVEPRELRVSLDVQDVPPLARKPSFKSTLMRIASKK